MLDKRVDLGELRHVKLAEVGLAEPSPGSNVGDGESVGKGDELLSLETLLVDVVDPVRLGFVSVNDYEESQMAVRKRDKRTHCAEGRHCQCTWCGNS